MIDKQTLIEQAYNVMKKSFVPFSNTKVGAAVLTSRGKCYTGCNRDFDEISICDYAERNAIREAFDKGDKVIKKIVIVSETNDFAYPSGVSRQMIYEYAPNAEILLVNANGNERTHTIEDLLPYPSKI